MLQRQAKPTKTWLKLSYVTAIVKLVRFTGVKNVLGQVLYGNSLKHCSMKMKRLHFNNGKLLIGQSWLRKVYWSVDEFIDLLVAAIDNLTPHSYIAKCQANYLKRKTELPDDCALVLGDFAENYTFVVQDEIQSFHWSKQYCTLHPVVVYYKENGKLAQKSFCFILNLFLRSNEN